MCNSYCTEVVRLSGYIADEKVQIARSYLEGVARERSGVKESQARVADGALRALIEDYCREARAAQARA